MDPEACLNRADQAISDCDAATAHEALTDYRNWRTRGGFEPHMLAAGKRGDAFAAECERRYLDLVRA